MTAHSRLASWLLSFSWMAAVACTDRSPSGPFTDDGSESTGGSEQPVPGGSVGGSGSGGESESRTGSGGANLASSTTGAGGSSSGGSSRAGSGPDGSGGRSGTGGTSTTAAGGANDSGGRAGMGGSNSAGGAMGAGGRANTGTTSAGTGGSSGPPGTTSVSFARDIRPIYMAKCASCHGVAQADVYSWLQGPTTGSCSGRGTRMDILMSKLTTPICGSKMPARGSLTATELNAFTDWVRAGAPEN